LSKIGKNHNYLLTVLSVAQTIVHILNLVLMLVFSVLLVFELRKKSKNVESEEIDCKNSSNILLKIKEKQKKTTEMVFYTSVVFCFEEISALNGTIMDTYMRFFSANSLTKFIFIFSLTFVLSKTVNIFIYKNFNEKFRLKMDLFNRKQEPLNKLKKQVFNNETEYVQALASKLKEDI
jgi:Mg2+/citrate symporter